MSSYPVGLDGYFITKGLTNLAPVSPLLTPRLCPWLGRDLPNLQGSLRIEKYLNIYRTVLKSP